VGLQYGTSYDPSGAYSFLVDSRFLEGLFIPVFIGITDKISIGYASVVSLVIIS